MKGIYYENKAEGIHFDKSVDIISPAKYIGADRYKGPKNSG